MLTAERLKDVLHYDLRSGVFTWLKTLSSRGVANTSAGSVHANGYRYIRLDGTKYWPNGWRCFTCKAGGLCIK